MPSTITSNRPAFDNAAAVSSDVCVDSGVMLACEFGWTGAEGGEVSEVSECICAEVFVLVEFRGAEDGISSVLIRNIVLRLTVISGSRCHIRSLARVRKHYTRYLIVPCKAPFKISQPFSSSICRTAVALCFSRPLSAYAAFDLTALAASREDRCDRIKER